MAKGSWDQSISAQRTGSGNSWAQSIGAQRNSNGNPPRNVNQYGSARKLNTDGAAPWANGYGNSSAQKANGNGVPPAQVNTNGNSQKVGGDSITTPEVDNKGSLGARRGLIPGDIQILAPVKPTEKEVDNTTSPAVASPVEAVSPDTDGSTTKSKGAAHTPATGMAPPSAPPSVKGNSLSKKKKKKKSD